MEFTKYEKARIIGARALQIAMGAPLLVDRGNEMNPIEIAKMEFQQNVLPITVQRVVPQVKEAITKQIPKTKGEENKDKEVTS